MHTVMHYKDNDMVEIVYKKELYIGILDKSGVKVKEKLDISLADKPYLILCIPLLKEAKMDYILQKATELGIDLIVPVYMERSIIKIEGKIDKKIERWQKIVKEASEQSKRIDIPSIDNVKKIDELNFEGLKLVCSTKEKSNTIKKVLRANHENTIIFVVGPEGGISPKEEEKLNKMGYISVTFGNRILRSETAPLFLASIINYEYME